MLPPFTKAPMFCFLKNLFFTSMRVEPRNQNKFTKDQINYSQDIA